MRRLCFTLLLFIGIVACDDSYKSSIPNVSFYFSCNLLQGDYSKLAIPGQFIKREKNVNGIPVGYAGLIIGQSIYSEGNTYIAYDAACPVEASRNVSVDLQDDGFGTAICPSCETKYSLSSGGAPEGKGTEYLKRYTVLVSGNTLQVRN